MNSTTPEEEKSLYHRLLEAAWYYTTNFDVSLFTRYEEVLEVISGDWREQARSDGSGKFASQILYRNPETKDILVLALFTGKAIKHRHRGRETTITLSGRWGYTDREDARRRFERGSIDFAEAGSEHVPKTALDGFALVVYSLEQGMELLEDL
jgi:anti-sigma factor ChrR (cupin superfamily)